jgi:hypothetical protein
MKTVYTRLHGKTYPHRARLSRDGWTWQPLADSWCRTITADDAEVDALLSARAGSATRLRANLPGCRLLATATPDCAQTWREVWRSVSFATNKNAKDTESMRVCVACGDHIPCTLTQRGWLCDDCCRGE